MNSSLNPRKLKHLREITQKEPEIVAGYLFGSYSQGRQRRESDIDLGFICFKKKNIDVVSFSLVVSKLFLPKEVDVLVCDLNERPLILMEMINGKITYQKSLKERTLLETRILKLYEDHQHLKNISNYYLSQSFTKGVYAIK